MFSPFVAERPDLVGQLVGNYRIVAPLGEGGMGAVYLCEHPVLERRAAVKVLHAELASRPDVVTRFWNEARAATAIGHPSIVTVLDFGQMANGQPYLLMEHLDGESLASVLRGGAMAPARAIAVADQIAGALAAAHRLGIVHRDLKPDNVFLLGERVKVLDFGIAKLDSGPHGRTVTGMVLGTPAYMAPEQCEGRADVDARADVYAMGIVLYQMLTGRLPFEGTFGELVVAHLSAAPPAPSSVNPAVPAALDAIVARALAKQPDGRFAGMDELRTALAAVAIPSPPRPRRWPGVAALVALVVLGILLAVRFWPSSPPPPPPPVVVRPPVVIPPPVPVPPPPPKCTPHRGGLHDPFCPQP